MVVRVRDGDRDPLPPGPVRRLHVSESLRQTRDEEVQEIAEEAYRGAHRLLTDHRDLLDEIAERLLDNEVIERDEIQHDHGRPPPGHRAPDRAARAAEAGRPAEAIASEPPPPETHSGA